MRTSVVVPFLEMMPSGVDMETEPLPQYLSCVNVFSVCVCVYMIGACACTHDRCVCGCVCVRVFVRETEYVRELYSTDGLVNVLSDKLPHLHLLL